MSDWGGAQWVLAMLLLMPAIMGPLLRAAIMEAAPNLQWKSGSEFWTDWAASRLAHAILVAILAWGGFW